MVVEGSLLELTGRILGNHVVLEGEPVPMPANEQAMLVSAGRGGRRDHVTG